MPLFIHNALTGNLFLPFQSSSFSSITDSTMSLNIITVTLNMGTLHVPVLRLFLISLTPAFIVVSVFLTEKYNFLGISIVGQSNDRGDGGIYIGSIMKGGAVAADGRIEPGDMLLQVRLLFYNPLSNYLVQKLSVFCCQNFSVAC